MKIPPLPDEVIDVILQLSSQSDAVQWQMGDVLSDLMDEIAPIYSEVLGSERAAHSWLIKHIASRTGLARSTINDRENVSRFFPRDMRDELEPLSYHQARALKSAGKEWRKYLEWSRNYADENNGAYPSVDAIRREIAGGNSLEPAWRYKVNKIHELLISATYDQPPVEIGKALDECIKQMEYAEKKLAENTPDMSRMPDTSRGRNTPYAYTPNEGGVRIR